MPAIDTTTTPHIGIVLSIIAEVGEDIRTLADVPAAARDVEQAGLDSVWVPDVITGDGRPALESMTVLGAVAGDTERGLQRAVRHGGWFGGGAGSGGPETLRPGLDRLREIAAELGMPMPRVTVAPEVTLGVGDAARKARDVRAAGLLAEGFITAEEAAQIPIAESVEQIVDALGAYLDVGVDELVTGPAGEGADWLRGLEMIAEAKGQLT